MQGAADGVLREALDCYEDGAIEEGDLSVIGLALEQFHHAVADRRATIGAMAPDMQRMRALPKLNRASAAFSSTSATDFGFRPRAAPLASPGRLRPSGPATKS